MFSRAPPFLRSTQRGTPTPSQETTGLGRGSIPSEALGAFQGPSFFLLLRSPGPAASQDSLSDDANEAVWPLSLRSPGPPLGSRPPRGDKGAQVSAAPQVQQARLSPRGQHEGPGSAGLHRAHDLWENKQGDKEIKLHQMWSSDLPPTLIHVIFSLVALGEKKGCFPKVEPTWNSSLLTCCLFPEVPKKYPKFSIVSAVDLPCLTICLLQCPALYLTFFSSLFPQLPCGLSH